MAKVDTSNCPKCGAPLEVHPGAKEIRCGFCGTVGQIYAPAPPPPPYVPMGGPPRFATPQPSSPAVMPFLIGALVILGIGFGLAMQLKKAARSSDSSSILGAAASLTTQRWTFSDTPMLADANGDGVPDVIGHAEWTDDGDYVAAFEGATGKLLWKTKAPKDSFKGKSAIVGDFFLMVDELGKVQATRISNGTPAWAGLLSDKADTFCQDGSSAIIEAQDKTFTRFDLATGRKSAVDLGGKKRPSCTPVYQTRGATPKYELIGWWEFQAHGLPELNHLPGMAAHRALTPTSPGLSFELGSREPGTQVAMVAAIENGKVLWKDIVPGVDPLGTDVNVTTILAASDGANVAIPYGMKGSTAGVRMACFEARSGKRLWDVQIHQKSNVDEGITIEAGRVYYASWTALYVLSVKDGKILYQLGHDF